MATSTIKASGGDYTSLSAWESAKQADITGNGPEIAECYDLDDTTSVTFAGWTTTASDYIEVTAATAARCNGIPRAQTTDTYRLDGISGLSTDFLRINGIEIKTASATPAVNFIFATLTSSSDVRFEDCLFQTGYSSSSAEYALSTSISNLNLTLTNCLIVTKARGIDTRNALSVTMDHCIFYTDASAFGVVADTEMTCTNTYAGGFSTEDFFTGASSPSGSHNASADTSASTDYTSSLTSKAASDQFVSPSVTDSSFDFSLKSGNSLEGAGTGSLTNDIAGNPYGSPSDIGCFAPVGGDPSLTVDSGSYSLTGQDVTLSRSRIMTVDAGSYTLTGQDVTLTVTSAGAFNLPVDSGSYSLTGQDVTLKHNKKLTVDSGSYTLTGQDVTLTASGKVLTADVGSYTLTGQDVTLSRSRIMTVDTGAYTLTGASVNLTVQELQTQDCYTWVVSTINDVEWYSSEIDATPTYLLSTINNTPEYVQSLIDDSAIYVTSRLCS